MSEKCQNTSESHGTLHSGKNKGDTKIYNNPSLSRSPLENASLASALLRRMSSSEASGTISRLLGRTFRLSGLPASLSTWTVMRSKSISSCCAATTPNFPFNLKPFLDVKPMSFTRFPGTYGSSNKSLEILASLCGVLAALDEAPEAP